MEGNGDEFAARGHGIALESFSRNLRSEIRGIPRFFYEHAIIGVKWSRGGRSHLLPCAPYRGGVDNQLVWSWTFVLADYL